MGGVSEVPVDVVTFAGGCGTGIRAMAQRLGSGRRIDYDYDYDYDYEHEHGFEHE